MSSKEDARIFVGGLSWDTSERQLEDAFSRFGKVIEAQVYLNWFVPLFFCFEIFDNFYIFARLLNLFIGTKYEMF